MDKEFIEDLAEKYADVCEFKSDFPHDWKSVFDGYVEGFKTAQRLENNNYHIADVSGSFLYELKTIAYGKGSSSERLKEIKEKLSSK